MIQPSQMSYPPTEKASQIPRMIVPPAPTPTAAFPTFTIGSMRTVPSGASVLRTATIRTQKQNDSGDVGERAEDVEGEDPVVEAHACGIL